MINKEFTKILKIHGVKFKYNKEGLLKEVYFEYEAEIVEADIPATVKIKLDLQENSVKELLETICKVTKRDYPKLWNA